MFVLIEYTVYRKAWIKGEKYDEFYEGESTEIYENMNNELTFIDSHMPILAQSFYLVFFFFIWLTKQLNERDAILASLILHRRTKNFNNSSKVL